VQLEKGARATLVRGLGVGVTGPSLRYGLDSAENWAKEGDGSPVGGSCNCRKEVRLFPELV